MIPPPARRDFLVKIINRFIGFSPYSCPTIGMYQCESQRICPGNISIFYVQWWCSCTHSKRWTLLCSVSRGTLVERWVLYPMTMRSFWMVWLLTHFCSLVLNCRVTCCTPQHLWQWALSEQLFLRIAYQIYLNTPQSQQIAYITCAKSFFDR